MNANCTWNPAGMSYDRSRGWKSSDTIGFVIYPTLTSKPKTLLNNYIILY